MMRDGNIEQWISELTDGALGPADAARVNQLIAADPAARELRDRYARLDAALRCWRALPAGQPSREWSELLRQKIEEDVARLMSEYEDGALHADEARRVARRFATDAAAARAGRAMQRTGELLEAWAGPLPPVDWQATHARFSAAVRAEAARLRRRRMVGWSAGLAVAACVALAAFVAWRFLPSAAPPKPAEPVKMVQIEIERPNGKATATIRFDPSAPEGVKPLAPAPSRGVALQPAGPRLPAPGGDDTPN